MKLGMRNRIEVATGIRFNNFSMPGIDQLADPVHRIQCEMVSPIGILLRLQIGLENRSRISTAAVCATRSRMAGTPNGRCPPSAWKHRPAGDRKWSIGSALQLLCQFFQPPPYPVR